jgi:hypothetical protein
MMSAKTVHTVACGCWECEVRAWPDAAEVLTDPCTPAWVRVALVAALQADPIDAANGAEVLAAVLVGRARAAVVSAPKHTPGTGPAHAQTILRRCGCRDCLVAVDAINAAPGEVGR